ncbi:MAG: hypothetical protein HYX68_13190 [Planctomycetes bacterium]|nr:hypothetical protein [Planctomycetota bacterium]
MTKAEAIANATAWLNERRFAIGSLRYCRYMWDFRSGLELACDRQVGRLTFVPSPFGGELFVLPTYSLSHGWLTVFNPEARDAETPEQCVIVWIDEVSGEISGRMGMSDH